MDTPPHRILLIFADGVGLGDEDERNPFVSTATPTLRALLGGPLTQGRVGAGGRPAGVSIVLAALDAVLGVPGLPQSGTGQTTLFTGVNAQAVLGKHVPALPGPRLRALIAEHGLLAALARRSYGVTFANAYTADFARRLLAGEARVSATTAAVLAAGVPLRSLDDLARGAAVTWDITGERFSHRAGVAVSPVPAALAGERLARLASGHHLTLFETFLTDLAGHHRFGIDPASAVSRLDGLLGGAVAALHPEVTLLLTSDHGNLEEPWHRSHTANPVPLLAWGPAAAAFADLERLDQVAPRIRAVVEATAA